MRISDWSSDGCSSDLIKRKLDWSLLKQAMDTTAKLSSFVVFILIGSTCFGLIFRAVNCDLWVEHLLTSVPGGETGFLIVVNILVFVLAFRSEEHTSELQSLLRTAYAVFCLKIQ